MHVFAALTLAFAAQSAGPITDIDPATIGRPVADPCNGQPGKVGFDSAWVNALLLERGYAQALICMPAPATMREFLDQEAAMSAEERQSSRALTEDRIKLTCDGIGRNLMRMSSVELLRSQRPWTAQDDARAVAQGQRYCESANPDR